MAEIWPTISESAREFQSPEFEKSVNTSLAVRWGARHHNVTTTARKARTWRTIRPFCTRGQMSWPQMFETYTMRICNYQLGSLIELGGNGTPWRTQIKCLPIASARTQDC